MPDSLSVPCPKCGAGVGQDCSRPSQCWNELCCKCRKPVKPHAARVALARKHAGFCKNLDDLRAMNAYAGVDAVAYVKDLREEEEVKPITAKQRR